MQSLRTKAAVLTLALAAIGMAPSVSLADNLQGQPIYAQNNTNRTIWVAAKYVPPGSSSFVSDGFWKINPGERVLICYNNNRYIYFYGRDGRGLVWSGGATSATVRGETLNMLRQDTGTSFDPWTMNFN